jgi:hypothetical protein
MVSADGGVWRRVTKHPATLWSALQHAMMRQWDDYLGRPQPLRWNERRRRANPEIRPEHWRVIRPSGDMWEDVRRKDRMVLTEAMEAIRNLKMAHPKKTLRIRNLRDGNVLMGAILTADIPVVQPNTGSMSPGRAFNNGFSGSKN